MSEEAIVTTVRMKKHTVQQVERLKQSIRAASFSDMLRRSVDISDMVVDTILKGGRVICEDKKGKQIQVMVTGVNR